MVELEKPLPGVDRIGTDDHARRAQGAFPQVIRPLEFRVRGEMSVRETFLELTDGARGHG